MVRLKRTMFLASLFFLFSVGSAFAVQTPVESVVDWSQVVALAVNGVLVFVAVQLVKGYGPALSSTMKQVLALAGGPLLMMFAQPALSGYLGYDVDFSPVANALTGLVSSAVAMASFDLAKLAGGGK